MTSLGELSTTAGPVPLRTASLADLAAIIELLSDDPLGRDREQPGQQLAYRRAFEAIDADPAHLLLVAGRPGEVLATGQLTLLPGLSRGGMLRAQLEAVRVRADLRGSGLGASLVGWVVAEARRRGCGLVQLTSDKQRADAHRFYLRLGFTPSHEGFKLTL